MSEANGPMIQAGQARRQQWAVLTAGMMLGVALAAGPAMAQGGDPPPPNQPNAPTGPAPQPTGGPTLTISQDGTTSTQPPQSPPQDEPSAQTLKLPPKGSGGGGPAPLIWAGTVLFADQSINSEGIGVGKDYQSRNPSYQLWFSARPRIALYNGAKDKVNVNARLDMTKELTNADDTTEYRQNMLGDVWLNFVYSHTFVKKNGWMTSALTGPRFLFPTSLPSQAAGIITTIGMGGGLMQMIPLNKGSEWFSSLRLFGSAYYTHPFVKSTTADNSDLNRPRATLNPNISSISNQLSGGLLVEHQVLSVLDSGVQITPKLGFTADLILIQQWRYRPSIDAFATDSCNGIPITLQTGEACAAEGAKNGDPQRYRLSSYLLFSVDYQLSDELNLSLNYYNFTNTIGPDGKNQNVFYAPDSSRFSFTATIGLDAIYERFRGSDGAGGGGAQGSRVAKGQTMGVGSFLASSPRFSLRARAPLAPPATLRHRGLPSTRSTR